MYVLNLLDGKRAVPTSFQSRQQAKVERNRLLKEGTVCVVSRGPDHPHGASKVDPYCQNKERTSRKRKRLKRVDNE
jgi:hypothetical protein